MSGNTHYSVFPEALALASGDAAGKLLSKEVLSMAARKSGIPRERNSDPKPRTYKPREPRPARSPRDSQAEQKPRQPK
jgi:hypothetical protein